MTESGTPLAAETAYFEAHRKEWVVKHEGEWAVVKGEELLGFFPDVGSGYNAGSEAHGTASAFLVKRVTLKDEPEIIQRAFS